MLRRRLRVSWCAFVLAAALAAPAAADVDVEIRNADKVKGSIDPVEELETFRMRIPARAKLTVAARGLRKGPQTATFLYGPEDEDLAEGLVKGKGSRIVVSTQSTGEHAVEVSSNDFETTGDYSLVVKWRSERRRKGDLSFGFGSTQPFTFSADAGAKVRVVAAQDRRSGSQALPRVVDVIGPDGTLGIDFGGAGVPRYVTPRFTVPSTGDYTVYVQDGGSGGAVTVTASITPPRPKPRRIDVSTRTTGTFEGAEAYARVLDSTGGLISVPDDYGAIAGTSISIPAGALPVGTAIVIATAPDLKLPGGDAQIGEPVFFGPEGLKFKTAPGGEQVLLSIPVDLDAVGGDQSAVVVYTRDAKGKVSPVPPPYDFDSEPGFVTFPTNHFSSYVAAADGAISGERALSTFVSGLNLVADVCLSTASDDSNRVFFLADGTSVLKEIVPNPTLLEPRAYAGGGTGTADGTDRLQFDFGAAITAVTNEGESVYVATPTQIFRIDTATGQVTTVLGDGVPGDSGDGNAAVNARMTTCSDLFEDSQGDLWFTDQAVGRVRRISGGVVNTVAGTGTNGSNGDQSTALATLLESPAGITEQLGTVAMLIAERGRVRRLDPVAGTIQTLAGDPNGQVGCTTGTATGTSARFDGLNSVAFDFLRDSVLVASAVCDSIYEIQLSNLAVTPVVGIPGMPGFREDGPVSASFQVTDPLAALSQVGIVGFAEGGPGDVRIRFYFRDFVTPKRAARR